MGVYIPPEEAARAKAVGLYDYFRLNRPGILKRTGRDYKHIDHDSFCLKTSGEWWWHSRGLHGSNALSYLIDVEGLSFQEAVYEVLSTTPENYIPIKKEEKPLLSPPEKDTDTSIIRQYLESRGIDPVVTQYFIAKGDIYQDKKYKSVCFVGRDDDGNPRMVNVRATRGSFKGNVPGSDRDYAFMNYYPKRQTMHLFEAPIDMLSYAGLIREAGYDFRTFNLVSLQGITGLPKDVNPDELKLPVCLSRLLEAHQDINSIYIHFDNDKAGYEAGRKIQICLSGSKISVEMQYPPKGYKDVNDFVVARSINNAINKSVSKDNEYTDERM